MKAAPVDHYKWTVAHLLKKRRECLGEIDERFARIAELRNDIAAIERTLRAFGYDEKFSDKAPVPRAILFEKGQLGRAILEELRTATEPVSTNYLANALIRRFKQDPEDRALLRRYVERICNAMGKLRRNGLVSGAKDKGGHMVWTREKIRSRVI